jgi:2-dehydro-3-deoxyphosphooctonate aldolase (KDO 8-P synthase)
MIDDRLIGRHHPLFVIAGPCVIESRNDAMAIARHLSRVATSLDLLMIFKASFDKANRTSESSYRGPGLANGLDILAEIRSETGLPILTDVHSSEQAPQVAEVVDVLQIPAFLCRQTDLIQAAARTGKCLNIKKGQFLSPHEMTSVATKAREAGAENIWLCERGSSFGYNNLVVDMRSLDLMAETGLPVVFDATHSVQLPGAGGTHSSGERRFVPVLARAAVAARISGVFMEVHPDPDNALSDGPNSLKLDNLESLLQELQAIDRTVKVGLA